MKTVASIYLLFICSCAISMVQTDTIKSQHPGFNERILEREELVKEVASYSGIDISDLHVLNAIRKVPRHLFIPDDLQKYAYLNRPLPIGYNQTISQPVIVASMTQMLQVEEGEKILEIGTGSGYQAAVLAELGCVIYSIEIIPELAERSKILLANLGYENVFVRTGDGYEGWDEHAPFDKIIVTCAPEDVPIPLVNQLSPKGRIVIPIGGEHETQYLLVLKRNRKGKLVQEYKYAVRFVPMTGKARQ